MSSVGFSELFLLFIIGLLILGPERLPRVASQIGRWVGRARRTANQLRYQLEREIADAERAQPPVPKPSRPDPPATQRIAGATVPDQPDAGGSTGPGTTPAAATPTSPAAEAAPEPAIAAASDTDKASGSTAG